MKKIKLLVFGILITVNLNSQLMQVDLDNNSLKVKFYLKIIKLFQVNL